MEILDGKMIVILAMLDIAYRTYMMELWHRNINKYLSEAIS